MAARATSNAFDNSHYYDSNEKNAKMGLIAHFIGGWSDHVEIYFLYKTQVAEAMQ